MKIPTLIAVLSALLSFYSPVFAEEQAGEAIRYSYSIVNTYPHDRQAFTQGLAWDAGTVYEGTGLLGRSSLRRIELNTGRVERQLDCAAEIFGEGITVRGDHLFQLTWKNRQAFIYNKNDFSFVKSFEYPRQGWGLTHDSRYLIASDGSATLYFLDPETFTEIRKITVHDTAQKIYFLNELEYINGSIYANIYKSDRIAIISPETGQVEGWIDLAGLRDGLQLDDSRSVLNGIMYNAAEDRLFVTGKFWPTLFEIRLIPDKLPRQ